MNSHETDRGKTEPGGGVSSSSTQERRDWLRSWALEHPRATIELAKKALKDHFGLAVGTEIVANILREVQDTLLQRGRELAFSPSPVALAANAAEAIPAIILDIVSRMRQAGIRRIEILPTGYDVLFNT